jgi:hypothetical protein
MAGLVPAIHVSPHVQKKSWMAGTGPPMTVVHYTVKYRLRISASSARNRAGEAAYTTLPFTMI